MRERGQGRAGPPPHQRPHQDGGDERRAAGEGGDPPAGGEDQGQPGDGQQGQRAADGARRGGAEGEADGVLPGGHV